jgi:hypothetical protein
MWILLAACTTSPTGGKTGTSSSPTTGVAPCRGSTAVPYPDGATSGYEQCDDGRLHRVSDEPAPPPGTGDACTGQESLVECAADEDCGGGELCRDVDVYRDACTCVPTCRSDADCAPDQACVGPGVFPTTYPVPARPLRLHRPGRVRVRAGSV